MPPTFIPGPYELDTDARGGGLDGWLDPIYISGQHPTDPTKRVTFALVDGFTKEQAIATAMLFAAAPDMHAVLTEAIDMLDPDMRKEHIVMLREWMIRVMSKVQAVQRG